MSDEETMEESEFSQRIDSKLFKDATTSSSLDESPLGRLKSQLEWIVGASFQDGGLVEEIDSPQLILKMQAAIQRIEASVLGNTVEATIFLDDLLVLAVESMGADAKMKQQDGDGMTTGIALVSRIYNYLRTVRKRCDSTLQGSPADNELTRTIALLCKDRSEQNLLLIFSGMNNCSISTRAIATFMTNRLESEGSNWLSELITMCQRAEQSGSSGIIGDVFNPWLDQLRHVLIVANKTGDMLAGIEVPTAALKQILSFRVAGQGPRPIADLLAGRLDFLPSLKTMLQGREIVNASYLGPYMQILASGVEDERFCDEKTRESHFADLDLDKDEKRQQFNAELATRRNWFRSELKAILHELLANPSTRPKTLDFLEAVLRHNRKRTQLRANRDELAENGAMVNLLGVLLDLSERITLDKVQAHYIFHSKCRVEVKECTRLKLDSGGVEEYAKGLDVAYEPKFTTECFYLTMHAMGVGLVSTIEDHRQLRRDLKELQRVIKDMEDKVQRRVQLRSDPRFVEQLSYMKSIQKRLIREYVRNDCLLHDDLLLSKCLRAADSQLKLLLRDIVTGDYGNIQVPATVPDAFAAMPEMYLENVLDLLLFVNRHKPDLLLLNIGNFPMQLLVIICTTHFFNNIFLVAKVVEVIFMLCPVYNSRAQYFWRQLISGQFAEINLFPSLAKYYGDVELTGSHTEFFDKFNIRRQIQVIFKALWCDLAHRDRMKEEASTTSPAFVRFVSMVINDSTFLLDESLVGLEKIHDYEALMDNEDVWGQLSDDEKEKMKGELEQAKASVPTWILFGGETLDMFIMMSNDTPTLFTHCSLGERVATMLNYNAIKLCGPECSKLKVRDAKRFGWNPKQLLEKLIDLYLSLACDQFAQDIAQDERSYTPEAMETVVATIQRISLPVSKVETFKNLAERAAHHYKIKMQSEMDFGDDIPEEFQDSIMTTVMTDPVRLPSGKVMDRKNILRHLLSEKSDPFTRVPMTESDLIPDTELKTRIKEWIKQKTTHLQD